MAETTNRRALEALRFRAGKETSIKSTRDEDLIEEIADFVMITTDQFENPNLQTIFRDIANRMIAEKSNLARSPSGEEDRLAEEQRLGQAEALGAQQAPIPPVGGLPPPPGVLPPTLDTAALAQMSGAELQGAGALGLPTVPQPELARI